MEDDGVADGLAFRIEGFLDTQGADVFAPGQDRLVIPALELQGQTGLPAMLLPSPASGGGAGGEGKGLSGFQA